jgi:hypothetical protein
VVDFVEGDTGSISGGWSLEINAPTEPVTPPPNDVPLDVNRDGLTDYAVVRPLGGGSDPVQWWIYPNRGTTFYNQTWGLGSDFYTSGDVDGDFQDDLIVWRQASIGKFFIIQSSSSTLRIADFGTTGDEPVVGDYNGDDKDDLAVYRSGTAPGEFSTWYWQTAPGTGLNVRTFGITGDTPAPGDYDGDDKIDLAIHRGEGGNGVFYIFTQQFAYTIINFGQPDDLVAPADYDGDGKTDLAVIRANGGVWRWEIEPSGTGGITTLTENWGNVATDLPIVGHYNRFQSADLAVWRIGTPATFWSFNLVTREISFINWGNATDEPVARFGVR